MDDKDFIMNINVKTKNINNNSNDNNVKSENIENINVKNKTNIKLKELKNNNNGNILINDILISMILFLVLFGIFMIVFDESNEKLINMISKSEEEIINIETLENLIKTPGSPNNWEKISKIDNVIVGLAKINENNATLINTIDYDKFLRLSNSYQSLMKNKVFKNTMKSSIILKTKNSKIPDIEIGENLINSKNIVSTTRTVKCDFLSKFKVLEANINDFEYKQKNICPPQMNNDILMNQKTNPTEKHLNNNKNTWICMDFSVNSYNLSDYNYYLLFSDDSIGSKSYWKLNSLDNLNNSLEYINQNLIYLNNDIENLLGNNVKKELWLHFKINTDNLNNFEAILISVPKNFQLESLPAQNKIDYFKENECEITLKTAHN
ncbi:MAG: hypothetical protein LBM96_01140 [Methanobrevibacter sp.]|jgi:hypothetical protein|nr:hypothetical protein [Candidatus Methanoflexus mossambicus]